MRVAGNYLLGNAKGMWDESMEKGKIGARKDYRNVKTSAPLDRGPEEIHSRVSKHPSEVQIVGNLDVVSVPRTTTIMGAVKTMAVHQVRRLPVVDAGSKVLEGMVLSRHVVDFLGGGDRYNLVLNKYEGNLLAAINEDVREIMDENIPHLSINANLATAISLMSKDDIGGLPLLNDEEKVVGIITERDILKLIAGVSNARGVNVEGYLKRLNGKYVDDYMSEEVVVASPSSTITQCMRLMTENAFRRVPLVKGGVLVGVITASDIVRYLGSGEMFEKLVVGRPEEAFGIPIKVLMRREAIVIGKTERLKDVAVKMVENSVGCFPVIQKGELIGIITEKDIIRALAG